MESGPGDELPPPTTDVTPVGGEVSPVSRRRLRAPRWWRAGGWRRWSGVALSLVLLGVAWFLLALFQVWRAGEARYSEPVDAIVVMGAAQYDGTPSPQLRARLDHVLELWEAGQAPRIVVTGGNRPGDRFTEAATSRRYLTDRGVPRDAILAEETGRTSWESLDNVARLARQNGITSVVLVSDPFHSLRIRLMAEELGLVAQTSATSTSPVRGWSAFRHHLEEAAGVAAGRIVGFDRLESLVG